MNDEGYECEAHSNPHEGYHLGADLDLDVQVGLRRQGVLEHQRHGGTNSCGNRCQDEGNEGEDAHGHTPPSRVKNYRGNENHQEVQDSTGKEKAEHNVRGNAKQAENFIDLGWQRDGCPGKELVFEDLDGVEPP